MKSFRLLPMDLVELTSNKPREVGGGLPATSLYSSGITYLYYLHHGNHVGFHLNDIYKCSSGTRRPRAGALQEQLEQLVRNPQARFPLSSGAVN